jgi:crotonobetainyl-CoA:carnitine CoA-transferase CaiB-like acyl-CoA transferase
MSIFDGIRVIDLSEGVAGALTTLLLAEQGADVIKVEPPGGDPYRQIEPGFFIWNRSKRSLTLDLRDRGERPILNRLAASADVLLDSYTPAQAAALELDHESIEARFPHLVHCRLTAYGCDHPWSDRPAIDALVAARLGLHFQQPGLRREGPTFLYCPFPSHGAAFCAALGICAALRVRLFSGRGQFVDTSMLDGTALITCMLWQWSDHPTPPFAEAMNSIEPFPQFLYECGDGRWLHHMMTDKGNLWVIARLLGVDLAQPAEGSRILPVEERRRFIEEAARVFKTRPRDEWIKLLREHDVPVEGVVPTEETLLHAQTRANQMVAEIDDPQRGRTLQVGVPIRFSKAPGRIKGLAPEPGQHSAEILAELSHPSSSGFEGAARQKKDLPHPLADITVVDFGEYLAGPFGPMLLADLGAKVIKVERLEGDRMRYPAQPFFACQRGKLDLALDLKQPEGLEVAYRLIKQADVVHHNQRPGVAERLKIDYATLAAIKPDLIYCHSAAYGTHGPSALMGGYDQLFEAMCGTEYMGGGEGNPPLWVQAGPVDTGGATLSAIATLMAIYHRDRTGEGQFVDGSLLNAGLWYNSDAFINVTGALRRRPTLDRGQTGTGAAYRIYETAQGWICVAAFSDRQWRGLCEALEQPRLAADRRFASHHGRVDHREELAEILEPAFRRKTAAQWFAILDKAGVPCEVCSQGYWRDYLMDPWVVQTGRVVEYFQGDLGARLRQFGGTIRFSRTPQTIQGPPPVLGEHTRQILDMLRYTTREQKELKQRGIVTWPETKY